MKRKLILLVAALVPLWLGAHAEAKGSRVLSLCDVVDNWKTITSNEFASAQFLLSAQK